MSDDRYDMVIVGAGPAGLMAAIEAARQGADVLVISDEPPGGLTLAARRLDNLPGYPGGIRPVEWVARLVAQVRQAGVSLLSGHVEKAERHGECWLVRTESSQYQASAVVMATGTRPTTFSPHVPESGLIHRDVRGLPMDLAGRSVAVIGAGEAAIDSALSVQERGASTTLLVRGGALHSCAPLLAEFHRAPIDVAFNTTIDRVRCMETSVEVHGPALPDGRAFDCLIIAVGREPRLGEIKMPVASDFVPSTVAGPLPGLYFAGDILRSRDRYVVSAMGDGQQAACQAINQMNSRSHA